LQIAWGTSDAVRPSPPSVPPPPRVHRQAAWRQRWARTPVALASAVVFTVAHGQEQADTVPPPLRISSSLAVPVGGEEARDLPVYFEADTLEGRPGDRVKATGTVKLTRGDLTLNADEVTHTQVDNTADARGHVRVSRRGDVYTGPQLT